MAAGGDLRLAATRDGKTLPSSHELRLRASARIILNVTVSDRSSSAAL